ncbi:hypothetical protein VVD49_02590 [Uliginosibacterium sp. H3]|uniref:Outer membrane protein assembly factor BamE n=1 Tax=Uliginosibacterium silvisoli TaxID=3114758 RepID=A0ABU6K051_9RHOO|nr:hypothetical protein [Uliginosibacterium sp. H3]
MSLRTLALYVAVLLSLGACATVENIGELHVGTATETDATKAAGRKPVYIWNNTDGTRTLDYSNQPLGGTTSWFVTIDAGGKILAKQRIEVDPRNNGVAVGMSTDQVRRMLGSPRGVATYVSGEDVWEWNTDTTGGPGEYVRFNVYFRNGVVHRTASRTVRRGECSSNMSC